VSQGAYVAMLHGTDEKNYIVRTGDKLADGTIRTITSEMMLIQQQGERPALQAEGARGPQDASAHGRTN
jgi:hypothetical protein